MKNLRLRGAMLSAGLTTVGLAAAVEVDAKSVTRWLTENRVPHPVTRIRVARVLDQQEIYLWPALLQPSGAARCGEIDGEQVWSARSVISSETWHALFTKATAELDIQVYAGVFLIETLDLADVLTWKASRGTRIRVLVGDPDSAAVRRRAAELSADRLPERCRSMLDYVRRVDGIQVRTHGTSHYVSIFRFDDTLLANPHSFAALACHSPVHQLQRWPSGELFDYWVGAFERTWIASC